MFKNKYALIILGASFLFLAFVRLQFPDLDHGDEFSDANILNAGENFIKFGFIKCKFLPMFEVNADSPRNLYTHVPPLPDILNGLQRALFRTDSLIFFRTIALFVAFLNLFFWYLFIRDFSGRVFVGLLAGLFYLTNSMFIFCMDALHQPSYADALRPVIFLLFFKLLTSRDRKPYLFFLVWILYFTMTLLTFEYIIYLALFFIFFPLIFKKEKGLLVPKLYIFVLMLAPICAFLLHFFQNAWYFGVFSGAFEDLRRAAFERIAHSSDMSFRHLTIPIWWKHAIMRNFSLSFMFNFYLLFTFLFFSYLFFSQLSKETRNSIRPLIRLFVLLIICGVSWYFVFPSHSVAHAFVNFLGRLLVPAASLAFTLFITILLVFVKEKHPRNVFWVALILPTVMFISGTGILKSQLPITQASREGAKDFLKFKGCLMELRDSSDPEDRVGINYYRTPFIRYYSQRNCETIFDRTTLENIPLAPRFFIFLPYNDQRSLELLAFIREEYELLFECKSFRFPAIFFELKNEDTRHQ